MAVNLSKNGAALMAAYKDVVDGRSSTNWALFTYEGDSNDIRLAEKGEGGLEEMVEELCSGKVMYAFCCVKDPNSGLPKYVLINWTGEGVKDSRKGAYANHLTSMANFLKGAHVTVNARAEEDVDPETVLAKVAKASGVNFNFQMKRNPEPSHVSREPVGSVYKKTNAKDEIGNTDKDRFWAQTQREEEDRRKDSSKKVAEEKQRVGRDKREEEERQRQSDNKMKSTQIFRNRSFQMTPERENGKMEQQKPLSQVSVYKKINARDEIQKTNKDHFWAQTQKEEEDLRKESRKRVEEEKQRMERDKRQTEDRSAKERQERDNEKKAQILQNRSFQKILEIEKGVIAQEKMVSVYKKINAREEIQQTNKDHFWAQTQKEEEDRRKESRKKVEEGKQMMEREKRQTEERQAKERQERDNEKRGQMNHNSFQKKQEMEKKEKPQQMTHTKEEKPTQNRTGQNTGTKIAESVQKANEAKLLISQRSFNPRDVFKQQHQQSPGLTNGPSLTPQPGKLRSLFLSQNSREGGGGGGRGGAVAAPEPKPFLSPVSSPVFLPPAASSPVRFDLPPAASSPVRFDLPPAASPSPAEYENHEPPVQPTDNGDAEDDWSDEFEDDDDYDEVENNLYDELPGDDGSEEPLYEDLYEAPPVEDQRRKARALYDYKAEDHTEITFDPHDLITGIEMSSEGWWKGYAPNGHYGLFPANYVKLL